VDGTEERGSTDQMNDHRSHVETQKSRLPHAMANSSSSSTSLPEMQKSGHRPRGSFGLPSRPDLLHSSGVPRRDSTPSHCVRQELLPPLRFNRGLLNAEASHKVRSSRSRDRRHSSKTQLP
jgi:hypothetical protein